MKKFVSLLILSVTVASVFAGDLRSELNAANKAIHQAMMKKDFAAMEKLMRAHVTKDFTYEEKGMPGKPQNFDQMIGNMKMGMSGLKKVTSATTKIISVKEMGSKATVVADHAMAGTMAGPDKKDHTMLHAGNVIESYVKINGKWKMSKMVWTTTKMLMDGKPMAMPPSGG